MFCAINIANEKKRRRANRRVSWAVLGVALLVFLLGAPTEAEISVERALRNLQRSETEANRAFSGTVPQGLTTNEALVLAQEAAGDEPALSLSWHRWAAYAGNTIAAVLLADAYWDRTADKGLSESRRKAYGLLGCEWYRRAAEIDDYARALARDRGCAWVK